MINGQRFAVRFFHKPEMNAMCKSLKNYRKVAKKLTKGYNYFIIPKEE